MSIEYVVSNGLGMERLVTDRESVAIDFASKLAVYPSTHLPLRIFTRAAKNETDESEP